VLCRATGIPVGGHTLRIPCFFPSISTVRTNWPALQYLHLLVNVDYPQFLISAYDLAGLEDHEAAMGLLSKAKCNHAIVLMDSGNYESFWLRDRSWTSDKFSQVLRDYGPHLAFMFDDLQPPNDVEAVAIRVVDSVLDCAISLPTGTLLPIVHGESDILPQVVRAVASRLHPLMIAVPERELGLGIVARVRTLRRIREELDSLGHYVPLHLLGTGTPISLLIYAAYGADSFDGLEWCKTVVDQHNAELWHFHYWDFFANSSDEYDLPYEYQVAVHNLGFYKKWMAMIQEATTHGSLELLLRDAIPGRFVQRLCREIGGVIS